MKLFSSLAPVAIVAIILVAVGVHRGSPISEDLGLIDAERSRLTAHFDSVTGILGATDVSRLTSLERGNRERALRHLVDYRDRGVFPHNHDFPGMPVPYFRDRHGVLCAMAYLIDRSGRGDIVDLVEARMNNGWIAGAGERFRHWACVGGMARGERHLSSGSRDDPTRVRRA